MVNFSGDSIPSSGTRSRAGVRAGDATGGGADAPPGGARGEDRHLRAQGPGAGEDARIPSPADGGSAAEPLVLVAEDEDGSRLAICEILRDGGYRTLGARDGLELIQLASSLQPVAILMDLAMPNLNGMEAVSALRSAPQTSDIRVVAITASWLGERTDLLTEAGFDGALRKPCSGAQLLEELDRVLSLPVTVQQAAAD